MDRGIHIHAQIPIYMYMLCVYLFPLVVLRCRLDSDTRACRPASASASVVRFPGCLSAVPQIHSEERCSIALSSKPDCLHETLVQDVQMPDSATESAEHRRTSVEAWSLFFYGLHLFHSFKIQCCSSKLGSIPKLSSRRASTGCTLC